MVGRLYIVSSQLALISPWWWWWWWWCWWWWWWWSWWWWWFGWGCHDDNGTRNESGKAVVFKGVDASFHSCNNFTSCNFCRSQFSVRNIWGSTWGISSGAPWQVRPRGGVELLQDIKSTCTSTSLVIKSTWNPPQLFSLRNSQLTIKCMNRNAARYRSVPFCVRTNLQPARVLRSLTANFYFCNCCSWNWNLRLWTMARAIYIRMCYQWHFDCW